MQRYHASSYTSAVNNSAIGGTSARDTVRADSSSLPANFSLNPRLGPPDYYPQTPNCPEETLTREYVLSGYKETVEGLEENKEISLTQVQTFTKPIVLRCKESIRKRLRAINESRAQKRKAGQVYGVPLSGSLLTKPGIYPEQKPCTEDFRKRWIEGLSQPHKRLRTLADQIPHGFRRRSLFEVLIRNNVPILRATWFIKVTYLNQVKPGSSSISSGAPDKIQLSRTEHWTKDVIEYLQYLLDEFFSRNNSHSTHTRDRSPQILYAGRIQHKTDPASGTADGAEPSLHFKWWYVVRILQWHHAEGLLLPSPIIDWVLNQLQEKELLEILQLLLPIIYGVIETVVLSQTYVRTLVRVAVRFIRESSPGGSDLVDNSRRAYTTAALIEMIRYLILAVPDTFVALDCFPLPPCVVSYCVTDGTFLSKVSEDAGKSKSGLSEVSYVFREKGIDAQYQPALDGVVSSIKKRADNLAEAASPGYQGHSVAKAVQALDKTLVQGDVRGAYKFLFEDLCDGAVDEGWIAEVSPCLKSSLKWISNVSLSFICSVFFLCEWATCDFRDYRTSQPHDLKFTGRKDFSQVFIAIRLLKLKIREMQSPLRCKNNSTPGVHSLAKGGGQQNNGSGKNSVGDVCEIENETKGVNGGSIDLPNIFQTPGSLHDIIVCWIDQHEAHKEGFKRVQLLIMELIRSGIFYPQAYVRQLIVSGYMDKNGPVVDLGRRKRHHRILKQLPASYIHNVLKEAQITEVPQLLEAMHIYSNERRLVLRGLLYHEQKNSVGESISSQKQKHGRITMKRGFSPNSLDVWKNLQSCTSSASFSGKTVKSNTDIEELKAAISVLLQFPNSSSTSTDSGLDVSQGIVKRPVGLVCNKIEQAEVTPGCEECKRVKRQKVSEERNSYLQGHSPNPSDDEDTWWVRKGPKTFESFKVEPPLKPTKQASRGRQKMVRKTQSLAQLAAARIEGSQGASTSHVCDNRVSCPHHRTGMEGEAPKLVEDVRKSHCRDIISIGKALKQLSFLEKMTISGWLITVARQCVEETEKIAKVGQFSRPFPADERSAISWKLGEEELAVILYLMDVCNNLVPAIRFLLWLFPKVPSSSNSTIHGGRNMIMLPRNVDSHVCEVAESFLLASIRRYENVLTAINLIPEALSAAMHRAAKVMAANGRISGSAALIFSRYLLRKYGNVSSVVEWEKNFKGTCDKRLLSELESARLLDGDFGFPLGVPAGVEDLDDFIRQKITSSRLSRVGSNMREIVQKQLDEAFQYFLGKEKKQFAAGTPKGPAIEKWDDGFQIAQQIIVGLMDCIRQTGGAAQEGDPSLVSYAVSAIVCNVGPAMAKLPDFTTGSSFSSFPSTTGSPIAQRILRIHISCLSLLKDALGERQSRIFEIALATEASSALTGVFAPGKAPRSQFQLSPESLDSNSNMPNDFVNNSAKVIGRSTKITAAVSALVIGAVVHGVTSLERMVTVFRLKEGLDLVQFVRGTKSNSNGNSRSIGVLKVESSFEIYVHWFRLLVGNCRTLSDGLIVELLGEPSVVALSRMQRTLPVGLVFPPAYSMFAFVIWRPYLLNHNIATRENIHQLYQSLTLAIGDAIKHLPFRDVCLRDTRDLYDLVVADAGDAEFAAMLELNVLDLKSRINIIVPLRARLFLNALIDCRMPQTTFTQDDGNRASLLGESKLQYGEKEPKLLDKLVHVLDALQPAKLHWQWVELRLLLNEQALLEKVENHDMPLPDAIRSLSPNPEKAAASENENNFIEIILTRLLVRPDAAPLFSEVVHLFGRSLEDSMLLQTKWILGGHDVLLGRKSIRQRLVNIAEKNGHSTKAQFWRPWGWSKSNIEPVSNRGDKRKFEVSSLEEGEVVEEGTDLRRYGRGSTHMFDIESFNVSQQHVTERALVELVLPCIDQSSEDSRNTFASDLIKQMNNIEQHISKKNVEQQINAVTRGTIKQAGTVPSGIEGPANKGNNRKGIRGGSPGLARRQVGAPPESAPPSPAALRASMSLRLQFILRLLPAICVDGEPSVRNLRHMLASVILRLLGSRVVHEDANLSFGTMQCSLSKREAEPPMETSCAAATSEDLSGESLFDRLLLVLHGLLSSSKPSWLKSKRTSNSTNEFIKDFSGIDRDVAESLQTDLDRMQLPDAIRWRIQAAMPMLLPSIRCSVSCQPPSIPPGSLASLQPGISISGFNPGNSHTTLRNSVSPIRNATNISGKPKSSPLPQDHEIEIDPWTLLEDGAGSGPSSSNTAVISSSDHANLRASSWLKGVVRVRRTDLTYIGSVDDDS